MSMNQNPEASINTIKKKIALKFADPKSIVGREMELDILNEICNGKGNFAYISLVAIQLENL